MHRAAVAGVALLTVVLLLGAPKLIGAQVEQQFASLVPLPGYEVVIDQYDRGWFSARVRWHVIATLRGAGAESSIAPQGSRWGFVTRVAHGPLLLAHSSNFAPGRDRPWIGYVALSTTIDQQATPGWRSWFSQDSAVAAQLDVTYGLTSGFIARAWVPQTQGVFADGATASLRDLDVSASGDGDDGVHLIARVASAELGSAAQHALGQHALGQHPPTRAPLSLVNLVLTGDMARAGESPWVWVGTVDARAAKLSLSFANTALAFADLQVALTSRLEDAGLLAAIVSARARAITAGDEQLGATQATFVAKSVSGDALAKSLQLQAQRLALSPSERGMADRHIAAWRADVLPVALKLSPELVLTKGDSHWAGEPWSITGRAKFDGAALMLPPDLSAASFWAQRLTAEVTARFANKAAQHMATAWQRNDGDRTQRSTEELSNESSKDSPAKPPRAPDVSLATMALRGTLVPTQHGYVANFAMRQGKAALNGQAYALPGVIDTAIAASVAPAP